MNTDGTDSEIRLLLLICVYLCSSVVPFWSTPEMIIAHVVEEERRGVAKRIDAVEHAAVTGDRRAEILDAKVALDGAHHRAAAEARHRDDQRHQQRLLHRE